MDSADALIKLREQLENRPDGPVSWAEIGALLEQAWPGLHNSGLHQTAPDKLDRAEKLRWDGSCLCFELERHGGTVNGSSRADLHEWRVNPETGEATCLTGRYRQLERRASPVSAKPIVDRVVNALEAGKEISGVVYDGPDKVRIISSVFFPDNACKMTIAGRRKRFRTALIPRLEAIGWKLDVSQTLRFRRKAT